MKMPPLPQTRLIRRAEDMPIPPFSPDLTKDGRFAALFIFGNYPLVSESEATAEVLRQVRELTPFEQIGPASIWFLERLNRQRLILNGIDPDDEIAFVKALDDDIKKRNVA